LHTRGLEAIEPTEQRERFFGARTVLDRGREEPPRRIRFAAPEGLRAGVDQLFPLTLAFRDGAAGAFDVRAGACVSAVQEKDARPDVDRELVLSCEVVIEAAQKQVVDVRIAIDFRLRGRGVRAERICHQK
jgi:hypothetical protein